MNKTELIYTIQKELASESQHLTRATIEAVVDSLGRVVTMHFVSADADSGVEVALPHLGKLKSATRAARTGRNPSTGAPVEIPERVTVKFSASKALQDHLNP